MKPCASTAAAERAFPAASGIAAAGAADLR
jgi:hypothetical protein